MKRLLLLILGLPMIWFGCSTANYYVSEEQSQDQGREPQKSEELLYKIFLIGDTGAPAKHSSEPSFKFLEGQLKKSGKQSAVIFLGDNIYPSGMPDSTAKDRSRAENILNKQLAAVENFEGRIIFMPGNHDWLSGGAEGLNRQKNYIENYLKRKNVFLPAEGFPGPIEIELMDNGDHPDLREDIRLIILDTQWWLQENEKPFGDTGEYILEDAGDFLRELQNALLERRNDHVMVLGHHPLFSNGRHGGHFPLKTHLLPPVAGSMYAGYRKFFGYSQDIAHYRYNLLKEELLKLFNGHQDLVYASGHEHSLQYFKKERKNERQHYIVSGAGTDTDFVAKGHGAAFTAESEGFATVSYYSDGSSWLEFWQPVPGSAEGKLLFRTRMGAPYADPFNNKEEEFYKEAIPDLKDSTVTRAANPEYDERGWLGRLIAGEHNRDIWNISVKVPVFDVGSVKGGLEPTEVGGTGQSTTMRLKAENGQEYVLRSIDKEAGRIWEEELKDTFANDIAQDQFSIIHPYGPYIIPDLADAAGVFHTNPELYYVPEDPRLGEYADLMAGEFVLFEERPDGDMSEVESMGNSEDVLGSRQMHLEVDADIDHRVDQYAFARARLFDMLIADWDRHPDQWRWASFEPEDKKGKIYKPIPRDRDMAFMRMNGIIPTVGKLNFFYQYQDFRPRYGNLKGLTLNSLGQTRRFTNQLTGNDWIAIADSMQNKLTDEVIEQAVRQWPLQVFEADGNRTMEVLRNRRDQLKEVSGDYYALLAGAVDVVGSEKHEWFYADRISASETRIRVEKRTREGEFRKVVYDRTFTGKETDEIRLYGLSGMDRFEVTGEYDNDIRLRIIGGPGTDTFLDSTRVNRKSRARMYDTYSGNNWSVKGLVMDRRSSDPRIHEYRYASNFHYSRTDPLLFFGSNTDDGLFLGGGFTFKQYGFRKGPDARIHTFKGNYAPATRAYNLKYSGEFKQVLGQWNLTMDISALSPNNIRNYFGLGNDTENTEENEEFYRARFSEYRFAPGLKRTLQSGITLAVRPTFEVTNYKEEEGRFITRPQAGIDENTFEDQWFGGMEVELNIKSVDDELNPKQGFAWNSMADLNFGLENTSATFSKLQSQLSFYYSPVLSPQLTVATRFGAAHNIGDFPFFSSNTLGTRHNLRGFINTRFAGRSSAYNNLELRTKLFDMYNYIFGGEAGALGFLDTGRVWADGEDSDTWHQGYGGGLWFSVYKKAILNFTIGFSEEGYYYTTGAGFYF
ncbi:MAG TPA: metallophosphoesterase [Halalkalibaculum sp.]|nr:metallophosphoesterase [Halalkalibaculum sp.]